MGILNVTPDSFSDGGLYRELDQALRQVELMVQAGADYVDIGGESTRPGAASVSLEAERQRVLPVIEAIKQRFDVKLSLDTYKPALMLDAIDQGVHLLNDVKGFQAVFAQPDALVRIAKSQVDVCLMHMQGRPQTMQAAPRYDDVVTEVRQWLLDQAKICEQAGIAQQRIILDPGFGFGKQFEHNLALFKALSACDYRILVGVSRKTFMGQLINYDNPVPVDQRLQASVTAAVLAAQRGAAIVRVHDVGATVESLKVWRQLQ